jgi:cholesterol transport system auxiliary component
MFKKIITVLAIASALSACSLLSPVANSQTLYEINAVPHHIARSCIHRGAILVATPKASSVYNTTDMVYSTYPHQVAFFAKNNWAATPQEMLKPLLINVLQKTHHFSAVTSDDLLTAHTYVLYTHILKLQQKFCNGCKQSEVILTVQAEIARSGTNGNVVIASKTFRVVEPALQNTPYGGVVAANRATVKLLKGIAKFCVKKT